METCAVMVVPCPERAEEILLAGDMPCPRCRGVLRPFGTGRTRTVRGVGADTVTVTPRRARCADCQVTQILLPTELLVRRARRGVTVTVSAPTPRTVRVRPVPNGRSTPRHRGQGMSPASRISSARSGHGTTITAHVSIHASQHCLSHPAEGRGRLVLQG